MTTLHECYVVVNISDDNDDWLPILWVGTNWYAAVETAEEYGQYITEIQTWIGSERINRYHNVQNQWVAI